jgi:hypothetical protein
MKVRPQVQTFELISNFKIDICETSKRHTYYNNREEHILIQVRMKWGKVPKSLIFFFKVDIRL